MLHVNYILKLGENKTIKKLKIIKGQEIIFSFFISIRWPFGLTIFYSNLHLMSTEIKPNRQPWGRKNSWAVSEELTGMCVHTCENM